MVPGTLVDDRYRLERVIGRGGMGIVMAATHTQLGTTVALKFLHKQVTAQASLTERFMREARATAALKSEHVCRVFDVGTFEGTPYIVMELLEGVDLFKVLRKRNRLPIHEACDLLIQACAGIAEAHAAQIIHRDLKPANLFLTTRADGSALVKVLDFGIAKAAGETDHELTQTDTILGSPMYMSLEQLRSSKLVDARSDIWSLGVILFEVVAGRRPFTGDGVADVALKIAMEPTPALPDDARALDAVIARCLARDPEQRFQDVAELALALAPFASEHSRGSAASLARVVRGSKPALLTGPVTIPMQAPLEPAEHPAETTMHSRGAIENPRSAGLSRSRTRVIGVVVAAIACGAALGVFVTQRDGDSTRRTDRATAPAAPAAVDAVDAMPPPVAVPPLPRDAAVAEPAVDATVVDIEIEPATDPTAVKRPVKRPPVRPSKKRLPKEVDLGKSRI